MRVRSRGNGRADTERQCAILRLDPRLFSTSSSRIAPRWVTCRPERFNPSGGFGAPTPTLCVFVVQEFGVSGHGDDRRPYRRAWTCPRGVSLTDMRFRVAIGTVRIGLAGTSSSSAPRSEADRRAPFRSHAR